MDTVVDLPDPSKALDLAVIRFQLIRLEDTIIFHLIERVQFPLNRTIYEPGAIPIGQNEHDNDDLSFMDWYLKEQERLQSLIRRYEAPDEYPFFPAALQKPLLKPIDYPKILHPNTVNANAEIKRFYIEEFLPGVCAHRTERGEAAEELRVHGHGRHRLPPGHLAPHPLRQVRRRVQVPVRPGPLHPPHPGPGAAREKAQAYGTDPSASDKGTGGDPLTKINVDAVVSMYKDFVIPLTKVVEVDYLMQRLEQK
ncbi:chorismate mutase [Apiospora phragmitis]|uniref:chorismate mutase n=1 Tax=Apiospora phragmitis TaxID=2905665 RepID=A0ABR1X5C4_9PEZI